jgi:PSP1 C-terminal conserved region
MSIVPPLLMGSARPAVLPAREPESDSACEYLVSYGKNGAFGRFAAVEAVSLHRGDRVVVHTSRGVELGSVLCPATSRHAQWLSHDAVGELLRAATDEDLAADERSSELALVLVDESRRLTQELKLSLEILDAEVLLDGRKAVLQFLAAAEVDVSPLADALAEHHDVLVLFENLATPIAPAEHDDHHGGCGKPDCGKTEGGGGCTTCSTGGGCSSCGSGKVDMTAYFAHLRTQMETSRRVPLA